MIRKINCNSGISYSFNIVCNEEVVSVIVNFVVKRCILVVFTHRFIYQKVELRCTYLNNWGKRKTANH